jgi:Protein of unknown function (DUF4232)
MTIAVAGFAGFAGFVGIAAMAAPAQAAAVGAQSHACSFTADRLTVAFAHPYEIDGGLDQPLSVTAGGDGSCVLTGRAKISLLDENGKALPYRFRKGADGITTEVGPDQQAVFDLTFATGSGDHASPSKIRITLPNGGGSRVIDWSSSTPTSKTITVGGFRPWLD